MAANWNLERVSAWANDGLPYIWKAPSSPHVGGFQEIKRRPTKTSSFHHSHWSQALISLFGPTRVPFDTSQCLWIRKSPQTWFIRFSARVTCCHTLQRKTPRRGTWPQSSTDLKWHECWGKWHKKDILRDSAWHQLFWNDLIRFKFHFVRQMTIWFSTNWKPQIQTFTFYLPNFILHGIKKAQPYNVNMILIFIWLGTPVFLPFHFYCACVEWCLQQESFLTSYVVPRST